MDVFQTDHSMMDDRTVRDREHIIHRLLDSPLPRPELIRNLGLFLLPMDLKRFLFMDSLYRRFLNVPGVIIEFGSRWGQNLAILQSLRAIYEPYNHRRTIVGFDTFTGFSRPAREDGNDQVIRQGAYAVSADYESYLDELLTLRESQSPLAHLRKHQVIAGDASTTFPKYLNNNPETIVAFAYFDMDIYQPTADCLRLLLDRVTKGSIIGFDELNHRKFPGETAAVRDVLGINNIRLRRNRWSGDESFYIVE